MYFVYVIQSCQTDRKYIGSCEDLETRLRQHNQGYSQSTKPYRPWELIHYEVFVARAEAMQREKYFESSVPTKYPSGGP